MASCSGALRCDMSSALPLAGYRRGRDGRVLWGDWAADDGDGCTDVLTAARTPDHRSFPCTRKIWSTCTKFNRQALLLQLSPLTIHEDLAISFPLDVYR